MVHRDVKAGNVLVSTDGQVKVADFGIARVFAGGDSELTQAGTVMGTATYFSPEQAQGKPVDPRSDLYSLGVVMYEMLVGRPPFAGDEPVAIAYAHVHEAPARLRDVDPALPMEIDAITMKLLAKDPAQRYPSADDLRADLRRFREGAKLTPPAVVPAPVPVAPTPPPSQIDFGSFEDRRYVEPPRRTGFFLLFTILVFAAVGLGIYYLAQQLDESNDATTIEVPDVTGENRRAARRQLERAGFVVVIQEESSEEVAVDVVIRQDPASGTERAEGSTVTLVVSVGRENVAVPDVLGQDIFSASAELEAAGFEVNVEQVEDPSGVFTEGQIWQQNPPAGTEAPVGSVVLVSLVPAETTTTSAETVPPATSPPATVPPVTATLPPEPP
jgi:serine/threonine-protein kinase